jgi:hypothetical protein
MLASVLIAEGKTSPARVAGGPIRSLVYKIPEVNTRDES